MNYKFIGILGLSFLIISRILMANGFDFLYYQKPIDFAHWFMLIGAVLTLSFSFVFPKSIFNTIATILTILGIIAHVGMCAIDFVLWSFGEDQESRNQLIGHLTQIPSIWIPFMTVGPSLLYMGLTTHAWKFLVSHTANVILTFAGSIMIGIGQIIMQDMIIVVLGIIIFSIGLVLLVYRKDHNNKKMSLKRKVFYIIGALLLPMVVYNIYDAIHKRIEAKKHRAWVATLEHTASDNVKILTDTISIEYLDEKRTLALYLPETYDTDTVDYPVIYFLDGQSLFDQKIQEGTEWEVDEVLDSISHIGGMPSIVIGIYNSENRAKEYKPFPSTRWYSDKVVNGDQHAAWIVNHVKPWIDQRYRTKKEVESTIIGGASLGGLMSYYMLMEYSEVFGGAIVFSPSFWVSEKVYTLHENNPNFTKQKIYFNAGELETPTVESIEKMYDILLENGMPEENMKLDVEEGLGHWHLAWKAGFRKVYPWIVEKNF